jgi:hypothetical protein
MMLRPRAKTASTPKNWLMWLSSRFFNKRERNIDGLEMAE